MTSSQQDRSSIELEKVLNDILPAAAGGNPEELNATLNALATALQGRGEELGQNLRRARHYLTRLNPKVPELVDDLDKLGQVSALQPGRARSARHPVQPADDVGARSPSGRASRRLLVNGTATTDTLEASSTPTATPDHVAATSAKVLRVLAQYSPEYPCLAAGLAKSEPRLEQAFGGGQPGSTSPSRWSSPGASTCRPTSRVRAPSRGRRLPGPAQPAGAVPGARLRRRGTARPTTRPRSLPSLRSAQRQAFDGRQHRRGLGSPAETRTVNALIAGQLGVAPDDVPAIATLLAAPILRGSEVSVGGDRNGPG